MNSMAHKESIVQGMNPVQGWAEYSISDALHLIENGLGSLDGCMRTIRLVYKAKSMLAWFRDHDLAAHKQWAYTAAKLQRMIRQTTPATPLPAYDRFDVLMSDHPDLVSWFNQYSAPYMTRLTLKDRDNPKQITFHSYQAFLALNGRWEELRERCERILSMELKRDRKYLIDHRFYLALANGDKAGMEAVLTELCSPKIARVRNFELGLGLTENLIATHATIYAKIAWRHGFEVEIDTPWIPREWLPVQPLAQYEDPWPFMQGFEIFQALEGEWAAGSPKAGLSLDVSLST